MMLWRLAVVCSPQFEERWYNAYHLVLYSWDMKYMILACMTLKFEFFWAFFTCWNSELMSPPNEIPYLVNTSVASAKAQYVQHVIIPYLVRFGWVNNLHVA